MLRKILLFTTGMLLVLVTGILWGAWFSLSRSMYSFSPETFIAVGKHFMQNVSVGMNILMPLGIGGLVALLLMAGNRKKAHFYWLLSALIFFVLTMVITLFIEISIHSQIKTWAGNSLPSDWQEIRDRWQFYHTDRTFLSLAGMACYLMAVIKRYS